MVVGAGIANATILGGVSNVEVLEATGDAATIALAANISATTFDLSSTADQDLTLSAGYTDTSGSSTFTSGELARFDGLFRMAEGSNIFSIYRANDSYCSPYYDGDPSTSPSSSNFYYIPGQDHMCMYDASSIRAENRVNYGQWMDKRGKLTRDNILVFLNKELASGTESYTEIGMYMSETNRVLYPGTMLGSGTSTRNGGGTQPVSYTHLTLPTKRIV